MAHDVFISYSSADKTVADGACATLEQQKIRCWMAPRDIVAGTSWSASIVKAINDSKVMVLIFSAKANESPQIQREVERAVNKGIPILPFRIENVVPSADLEYFLSVPHWLDAMHPPLEDHLQSLAETVRLLIAKPGGTAQAPKKATKAPTSLRTGPRPRRIGFWVGGVVAAAVLLFCVTCPGFWWAFFGFGQRSPNPPGPPNSSKDFDMQFALLDAGEFTMGFGPIPQSILDATPKGEVIEDADNDAKPAHRVKITRPFYMGVTEVTVRQFREFVDASGHRTDAERSGGSNGYKSATNEIVIDANFNWQYTGFPQTEDHPVVNVSWNDAAEFCTWLSKKQGVAHRLPTEAEWEYACRAGSDKFFSHGDHIRDLEGYANLADAAFQMKLPTWDFEQRKPAMWNDGFAFTAPVKSFKPNAWGLYDMHGNVAEWCADWYDAKAYRAPNRVDPRGPTTGTYRIRRGSSWMEPPVWSAVADRWGPFPGDPALNKPEFRCINFGFRVVKVAP